MGMLKSMATVSGFTAMSRVLGFLRDIFIARYLGAGMVADAFFSAFRFPNLFRRVFGEGAFNAAFVPLFGRELEERGKDEALKFASSTFSMLALVLGIGTLLAIPSMGWIMSAVVPGFKAADESPIVASADPQNYEFNVNVKGANSVFFVVENGSVSGLNGTLSAPEGGDLFESISERVGALMGADYVPVPEADLLAVSFAADGKFRSAAISATLSPSLANVAAFSEEMGKKAFPGKTLELPLPLGHDYKILQGTSTFAAPVGSQLEVYRNHPDTFSLTVKLSQITFVYLLCMALVAHLSGVLNTMRIFGMPAAAPVLLNAVFLVGLLIVIPVYGWKTNPVQCGYVAAWCVAVAGFVQLAALWITCRRKGLPVKLGWPKMSPQMKRLFTLMGPGVVAAGIQQINLLIGSIIASHQEGAVSYLYYSDRIYQLPLGMIGIALGVVLLPDITRRLRSNDLAGAQNSMNRGIELALLITLPAMVAMLVIPEPIVAALFQRGEFGADKSLLTAQALAGFAIGLPGYVLIKVLQPGYFAQENTKSPMIMAGVTVAVNIIVSLLLFPKFRHVGIAVATTVAAWVNVILLARGLRGFLNIDAQLKSRIARILAASIGMGVAVWALHRFTGAWFDNGTIMRALGLALLVGTGMAVYAGLAVVLKATSLRELKEGFRR